MQTRSARTLFLALALWCMAPGSPAAADPAATQPATQSTVVEFSGVPDAATRPDAAAETLKKLQTTIPVNFEQNSLKAVIDYIRNTTDANIFVNWPALLLVGIEQDLAITLQVNNVSAERVLDLVLQMASAAAGDLDPIG